METTCCLRVGNVELPYVLRLKAVLHMEDLCGRSCLERDGINTITEMGRVESAKGKTGRTPLNRLHFKA